MSVTRPGLVCLKPGDIYGMPHLTPGLGAGVSTTQAPIASGGQVVIAPNISSYQQPGEDSNVLAKRVVGEIVNSGALATALVNGGTTGVRSILQQQGLV